MFLTPELNTISTLIEGHTFSSIAEKYLEQKFFNLEAALLRAKVLRGLSKENTTYIIQPKVVENSLDIAYLFSGFILSNLNNRVYYHTQRSEVILNILNCYYKAEKSPKLKSDNIIKNLNLYLDINPWDFSEEDFIYFSLINALCRSDLSNIFIITKINLNSECISNIEKLFKLKIHVLNNKINTNINLDNINLEKLLFKNKDQTYINLCQSFSIVNAPLVQICNGYEHFQATNLVEDMFYSEHIHEKMSVYGEYIQTRLQNKNLFL
ncbi:hypothetical protein [Acinetobacter gerneri]|jgi:hypothetical protein|uniref:hypothetical protein n=1 Tax=Acinetobacter gerneri TaxID=202952 RepID=UPI0023F2E38A|nr:hypothetical protein [Acinetobacter gerneri]MCH4244031.1 hypothetical protein [Acinetobacter gerneri]